MNEPSPSLMPHPAASSPDMDPESFRRFGQAIIDRVADYLERPDRYRVLPDVRPGDIIAALPHEAPADPEPFDRILEDYDRLIPHATTHWNHPGFFAWFAITGSAPGILAETLCAALNVNAMLWRSGPAATELEQVTTGWLRGMIGLPADFHGHINDTASMSTLHALAAARESLADLRIRQEGLSGRAEVPRLRVYRSAEAHSSVDKAVITLGLGLSGIRTIATDEQFRMDAAALQTAISQDRAAGIRPMAVVATVGTTSTTSVDPVPEIARICQREGVWLHVDAAYGGSAAAVPEHRDLMAGCEHADSLVVNPHKWMFVPVDCSVLFVRSLELLKQTFSLVPDYLTTTDGEGALNLMDLGVPLGRRFRALKLWFVLRYFGRSGIAAALREHIRLARLFAGWVDADPTFERLAPVPLSVVVFRHLAPGLDGSALDRHNLALIDAVNASGEVFLSHTRVRDRWAIRLAVGNLRTSETHVRRAWELLKEQAVLPNL